MRRTFMGIDPGLHGAVAILDQDEGFLAVEDTPITIVKRGKKKRTVYLPVQMAGLLKGYVDQPGVLVCLENIHAMPGQGVTSMFSMGTGFGLWQGIIAALGLPLILIEPRVWKKAMVGVGADKNQSIVIAQQTFPLAAPFLTRKKDDGRAEAILIAEYVRNPRYHPE